jgi:hypothetical protein
MYRSDALCDAAKPLKKCTEDSARLSVCPLSASGYSDSLPHSLFLPLADSARHRGRVPCAANTRSQRQACHKVIAHRRCQGNGPCVSVGLRVFCCRQAAPRSTSTRRHTCTRVAQGTYSRSSRAHHQQCGVRFSRSNQALFAHSVVWQLRAFQTDSPTSLSD